MFERASFVEVDDPVDPEVEDAFDWMALERDLRRDEEEQTWGDTVPSGLFAWELDSDTGDAAGLSDAQLIDAMAGFERLAGWAQARQARTLAEFARRRPGDDSTMVATDKPCAMSEHLRARRGRARAEAGPDDREGPSRAVGPAEAGATRDPRPVAAGTPGRAPGDRDLRHRALPDRREGPRRAGTCP